MNTRNYLIKLKFKTSIHIGSDSATPDISVSSNTVHADTFYSALLIEALKRGGEDYLKVINGIFKAGAKISDLMPYCGGVYFVPKPILSIEQPSETANVSRNTAFDKKALKNLTHIDIGAFGEYIKLISGMASSYDPSKDAELLRNLGRKSTRLQLKIEGIENGRQYRLENSMPYYVGTYTFNKESGLYLLLRAGEEHLAELINLISSLGYSGIGGRVSSGLGKFELDEVLPADEIKPFAERFNLDNFSWYMSLSVCLPKDEELEDVHKSANYLLLKRSGFVQSATYSDTLLKKKDIYAFSQGSVFNKLFEGDIFDVSCSGSHEVYRYLKSFFIGVL